MFELRATPLMKRLAELDPELAGRAYALHSAMADWLSYVPATFGHYTRHTIGHSDEIIEQLGLLLFDSDRPVVAFSATEIYVLLLAAMLHDAGMVTSEAEKVEIVSSPEWDGWVTDGGGAAAWQELEAFRSADGSDAGRRLVADLRLRQLIAEYVRRRHHERVRHVLAAGVPAIDRAFDGDPILRRTVEDICVGHGLPLRELDDPLTFPHERTVGGDQVAVRMLALLLRLGDLLDLRHDRGCPLLMHAAAPLPPSSGAHWSQFGRLVDRLTSPAELRVRARCAEWEEHALLHDWCAWLDMDCAMGAGLLAGASRHSAWRPPRVVVDVAPAPKATYLFERWKFAVDAQTVISRFVNDLYRHDFGYVRELIQNAVDANRCRLYADLATAGEPMPAHPVDVPEEVRERYPVHVSLSPGTVKDPLTGEDVPCEVLVVEDAGIGMDRDVVERYLLQIGRSYYDTETFRREYPFSPISRFGVGFLSVFSISDFVVVETLRHGAPAESALKLVIPGPRSYFLTERGTRSRPGTRVSVYLRPGTTVPDLDEHVAEWCRFVEFPVEVSHGDVRSSVRYENPADYERAVHLASGEEYAVAGVRAYPLHSTETRGAVYVQYLAREDGAESWASTLYLRDYRQRHPLDDVPHAPRTQVAVDGFAIATDFTPLGNAVRIDYRGRSARDVLTLARDRRVPIVDALEEEVETQLDALLTAHFATAPAARGREAFRYRNAVAARFPRTAAQDARDDLIPIFRRGTAETTSVDEVLTLPSFTFVVAGPGHGYQDEVHVARSASECREHPVISHVEARQTIAGSNLLPRYLDGTGAAIDRGVLVMEFDRSRRSRYRYTSLVPMADGAWIVAFHLLHVDAALTLINENTLLGAWLRDSSAAEQRAAAAVLSILSDPTRRAGAVTFASVAGSVPGFPQIAIERAPWGWRIAGTKEWS